jgi:hypothetical protein
MTSRRRHPHPAFDRKTIAIHLDADLHELYRIAQEKGSGGDVVPTSPVLTSVVRLSKTLQWTEHAISDLEPADLTREELVGRIRSVRDRLNALTLPEEPPVPGAYRARESEKPKSEERAIESEKPKVAERAREPEKPTGAERANGERNPMNPMRGRIVCSIRLSNEDGGRAEIERTRSAERSRPEERGREPARKARLPVSGESYDRDGLR